VDAEAIRNLIQGRLCKVDTDHHCRVSALPGMRPYSRVYRVLCRCFPGGVFVKQCLQANDGEVDRSVACTQFRGLQRAWERCGKTAPYGVPQPLMLFEDEAIVVTEWVQAENLTKRLRRWLAVPADLHSQIVRAAQWLHWYHQSGNLTPVRIDCGELIGRLREGDPAVLNDAEFKRGCGALRQAGASVCRIAIPRAELHGDYKADNVLMTKDRVVAIDLQPDFCDAVLFDIASFLNHLELMAWHPKAWLVAVNRDRFVQAFLRGYFVEERDSGLRLALSWIRLFNALGAWLDAATESTSRLRYRYAQFCYRRLVRSLGRELQAAFAHI